MKKWIVTPEFRIFGHFLIKNGRSNKNYNLKRAFNYDYKDIIKEKYLL